jgi:hypothetical protein
MPAGSYRRTMLHEDVTLVWDHRSGRGRSVLRRRFDGESRSNAHVRLRGSPWHGLPRQDCDRQHQLALRSVGVYKLAQTAFASALVWRDSGGTVSCTLKATDYQGFLRFSAKKSASASNPQTLSWSFDALEDTTAHIECTLPKASSTVAGAGAWVSYVRLDQ